jgi:hypothetical protein
VRHLKEISLLALLAAFYLGSVYFAVSALVPALALQAAFIAAMGAIAVYFILVLIRRDEPGIPLALLILAPIICLTAGVAWWLLRLLGLWEIRRHWRPRPRPCRSLSIYFTSSQHRVLKNNGQMGDTPHHQSVEINHVLSSINARCQI